MKHHEKKTVNTEIKHCKQLQKVNQDAQKQKLYVATFIKKKKNYLA